MSNSTATTKKLGQMLVERGWITGEQLIRAIQSQRVVGGRIGTCLLEMDVLKEDKLLEALSNQLSVPAAHIDELRAIDRQILELVPRKVASHWQAVPLSAGRHEVRVATLNVSNLACLDELEFCANKRVVPHIANEARIFEALERYYGIECPRRYGHLLDRLNRSRYMWDESAKILLGAAQAELGGGLEEPPWAGENGDDELMLPPAGKSSLTLQAAAARPTASSGDNGKITWPVPARDGDGEAAGGAEAAVELTLDDVERLLAGESDQKSIGRTLLRFLSQRFSRCAIFSVHRDGVRGWLHDGESFDDARFDALEVTLDQPSAFLNLAKGSDVFVGPLPPMPAHHELARCWGGELPEQSLMVPVRLRGRLISVLYADRGSRGLADVEIEPLKALSEKAAVAFELCILRRKQQQIDAGEQGAGAD